MVLNLLSRNKRLQSQITCTLSLLSISSFPSSVSRDHRNPVSTAGVPMLTEVNSPEESQTYRPSRRNDWEGERKHVLKKDWYQGTGEQLYRCIGADDTGCLGTGLLSQRHWAARQDSGLSLVLGGKWINSYLLVWVSLAKWLPARIACHCLSHLLCWRPNKTIKVCEEDWTEMCPSWKHPLKSCI